LRRIEDMLARWLVPSRFSLGFCGLTPGTRVNAGRTQAVVEAVAPDGPAGAAAVAVGDVIARVNGVAVTRAIDVGRVLWRLKPGDRVVLTLDGKGDRTFSVATMGPEALARVRLHVALQPLTATLNRALGLPDSLQGLAISEVLPDSDLAAAEARRGDVVIRIGDMDTASMADVFAALKDLRPGATVPVYLVAVESIRGRVFLRRFGVNVTLH
jgi:serine protease Do